MHSLLRRLGLGWKKDERGRLSAAYHNLFSGNGGKEDADLVLQDIGYVTGYHDQPSSIDGQTLAYEAGKRSVMKHILSNIEPSRQLLAELRSENAAMHDLDYLQGE